METYHNASFPNSATNRWTRLILDSSNVCKTLSIACPILHGISYFWEKQGITVYLVFTLPLCAYKNCIKALSFPVVFLSFYIILCVLCFTLCAVSLIGPIVRVLMHCLRLMSNDKRFTYLLTYLLCGNWKYTYRNLSQRDFNKSWNRIEIFHAYIIYGTYSL